MLKLCEYRVRAKVGTTHSSAKFKRKLEERINVWLFAVGGERDQQLGALVRGVWYRDEADRSGPLKDWIEEHGGDREWYVYLYADIVPAGPETIKRWRGGHCG